MEKDRKFRALAIAAICIAVVGVSVAYAALAASLTITGTATVDTAASWSVIFDEDTISTIQKSAGVTVTEPALNESDSTILEWAATFTAPGQKISFSVDAKNAGSIDAIVNGVTKAIEGTKQVSIEENGETVPYDIFTYTVKVGAVTVEDLASFGDNTRLAAGESATISVEVIFDEAKKLTAEHLTDTTNGVAGKTANFTFAMTFGQAAGTEGTLGTAA